MKVPARFSITLMLSFLFLALFVAVTPALDSQTPLAITKPSPTYTVQSGAPKLSAYATSSSTIASAKFTVDNLVLNGSIDNKFKRVDVKVPTTLAKGTHNVSLSIIDSLGNNATTQWEFKIDTVISKTFPDMTVSTYSSCWQMPSQRI